MMNQKFRQDEQDEKMSEMWSDPEPILFILYILSKFFQ